MARDDAIVKAELALHDQSNILPQRQLIFVFCIMAVALLVSFIDQNGISTTLPTIAADLNAEGTMSWAGTASLIANTTFQMLYGRLSDIFGRKTVFLAAIGLLGIADLLCGLSYNAAMFYVCRGLAGIGGGGITNLAMIIVSDIVTLEQRGKYQGILGSMVGLGNVAGPFLAAAFADAVTWRAFFWLLAPLNLLTAILCYFYIPAKPRTAGFWESVKKIDYLGSLSSSVAVIFLLIPISGGGAYFEWNSPLVISFLIIGGVSLILFFIIEWKVAKLPMMPVAIYKSLVVDVMLAQSFFLGLVYQITVYYVPLYLQNAHGYSPIMSAVLYAPMVLIQSTCSIISGLYISHFKRYGEVIWFGFGIWTLGTGLTLIYGRNTDPGIIIIPLILIGIGVGFTFQPTLIALQAHSTKSRRAVIISNRNFMRCSGGAVGLAMSAQILQATLRDTLPPDYAYLADSTYSVPKGNLPNSVLDAYMTSSHTVFIAMVPFLGACFLGTAFIKDRGLELQAEKAPGPVRTDEEAQDEAGPVEEVTEATEKSQEKSVGRSDAVAADQHDGDENL